MTRSLHFIINLYNKLSENYAEVTQFITDNSDEIDQIYESIAKRDMMMTTMTKLLKKEHHKINDLLYTSSDRTELSNIKKQIFDLANSMDQQHDRLESMLQTVKENLSIELKNVSINKSKIKGYNLNCVK